MGPTLKCGDGVLAIGSSFGRNDPTRHWDISPDHQTVKPLINTARRNRTPAGQGTT